MLTKTNITENTNSQSFVDRLMASASFMPLTWRRSCRRLLSGCIAVGICGGLSHAQAQDYYTAAPATTRIQSVRFSDTPQDPVAVVPPVVGAGVPMAPKAAPVWEQDNSADEAAAAKAAADLKKKAGSAYKGVFFNNDFSYLNNPAYSGSLMGESLKQRCLPGGGTFDIGGQYRFRGHSERNMRGLGLTGVDDQFLLYRTRIYGDFRLNSNIRVYAEMLDAESSKENFGPRPIEVNRTELQNLFVDAKLFSGANGEVTARLGRQELVFGAQRNVSPLDWANTRRTFEGVRMMAKNKGGDFKVDGFWTNPVRIDDHSFDSPDRDQEFMGVYTSYTGRKDQTIDTYFLRYLNGRGANDFEYNTVGARWQGTQCGTMWDVETAWQFGDNTDGSSHAAGMATFGVGRKLSERCWNPTVWMYYDYASGDDATGAGNGFHHNFPLAHKYLGFMDLFGRRNIEDVNFRLTMNPNKRLKLMAWYHYMFLETQTDTPYSVVMSPFNGGNQPGSADLGHEIDLVASYKVSQRRQLLVGYSRFFSGGYYDTTAGVPYNGDAEFFYTQFSVNF